MFGVSQLALEVLEGLGVMSASVTVVPSKDGEKSVLLEGGILQ